MLPKNLKVAILTMHRTLVHPLPSVLYLSPFTCLLPIGVALSYVVLLLQPVATLYIYLPSNKQHFHKL